MMEKVDEDNQDQFLWTSRPSYQSAESETLSWRERKTSVESTMNKHVLERLRGEEEASTKLLAALVPDEIINDCYSYEHRDYDACLLLGDVSGFTELGEKYQKVKGGPSRLTNVLNDYMGTLIQEVMSYGGDITKFSGSAFMAMWKAGSNMSMPDCVHQALDCALVVQKSHGKYTTDMGNFIQIKLALAAGEVVFSIIGGSTMSAYVCIGQPVWDSQDAIKEAKPGEIIVSHTAWNYVNVHEYLFIEMEDRIHIKVLGFSVNWRTNQGSKNIKDDISLNSLSGFRGASLISESDLVYIRPAVKYAGAFGIKEDLRKFIISPIMHCIDLNESLDYLTEMRNIVIIFMSVSLTKIDVHEYIRIVDKIYKIVCNIVVSLQGCINKVALGDFDLLFVIIFGFRGLKHDLESQRGLRCAMECYTNIHKMAYVQTVSIAITAGISYCGLVGHVLRRVYTVISVAVNKATGLMTTYPNKLVCDRETFLHSKLDPRFFVVQDYIPIAGLKNIGPVYEFRPTDPADFIKYSSDHPILGRNSELETFVDVCVSVFEVYNAKYVDHEPISLTDRHNALILTGDARIGKSRLAEEIYYRNCTNVQTFIINLPVDYMKIPYQMVRTLFGVPLGMSDNPTILDLKTKLISRLRKVETPEVYCALNKVFGVDFEITRVYQSFSNSDKNLITHKIIKQLCYVCFAEPWVIIIDNGHYIDDHSWPILKTMMDTWLLSFLITVSKHAILSDVARSNLYNLPTTKHIILNSIDKWYHAGIACQFLSVHGIPPELEKVIQRKSNGNPGWIESFLSSLLQSKVIRIKNVRVDRLVDYGIVIPPRDMTDKIDEVMDYCPSRLSHDYSASSTLGTWKMYENCFRESLTDIVDLNDKHESGDAIDFAEVSICLLVTDDLGQVESETTLDVMTMKTFDKLSSYEQMLLKCSAIIGESYPRDMLMYVMNSTNERMVGLSIKRLFEIGVLECARGDFTNGEWNVISDLTKIPKYQNKRGEIAICACKGLTVIDEIRDLPKYASCGFLRFTMPSFRTTTYSLMTDSQKKEFHARAVRYLEKKTRRCQACGNGLFVKVLGTRFDDGLKRRKINKVQSETASREHRNSSNKSISDVRSISISNAYKRGKSGISLKSEDSIDKNQAFGFMVVKKLRYKESLLRTFSSTDYSNCRCPQILKFMYKQLLEHCEESDLLNKWLDACIEYSKLTILTYNLPKCLELLNSALEIIKTHKTELYKSMEVWKVPFLKAKIYTLMGNARLDLGQLDKAQEVFTIALQLYGYTFPKSSSLVSKLRYFKQMMSLFCVPRSGTKNRYEAEYCDDVSDCLSLMCRLFMDLEQYGNAEAAAIWSLNCALESEKDFAIMCIAYGNLITLFHLTVGRERACIALEVHALRICQRFRSYVESSHLKAVSLLYNAIFQSRIRRAEIERSIDVGYVLVRICNSIHNRSLALVAMPILMQVLLIRLRFMEVIAVLLDIDFYSADDLDNAGKTWYYALSVMVQIETGYTVNKFRHCERFLSVQRMQSTNHDSERATYTIMWLWCIRNELYEAAETWHEKVQTLNKFTSSISLYHIFTLLYYLEGLILLVVNWMDKKDPIEIQETHKLIKYVLDYVNHHIEVGKVCLARLLHLKAFYTLVVHNDDKAFTILQKAKKAAIETDNLYEEEYIKHSEMAWHQNLSTVDLNFWRDHCQVGNSLDYHEYDYNDGKIGYYTLNPPIYL